MVLQSTVGISPGRAESLHCDITKVICAVMLTDLPKLELVFVVESKKTKRDGFVVICWHSRLIKMYDMKCLWLMQSVKWKRREITWLGQPTAGIPCRDVLCLMTNY